MYIYSVPSGRSESNVIRDSLLAWVEITLSCCLESVLYEENEGRRVEQVFPLAGLNSQGTQTNFLHMIQIHIVTVEDPGQCTFLSDYQYKDVLELNLTINIVIQKNIH